METFVSNLQKAILDSGLSKRAFAERVGITHGALNNYLDGRPPKLEEAQKISKFLGLSLDQLLHGSEIVPANYADVWKARALAAESKLEALKNSMMELLKKY
jgi:transcriptional regulator with XRE-family HTH domain